MAKFKLWVSTDKIGSRCEYEVEIPDGELEDMSAEELDEYMREQLAPRFNWSYERLD